MQELESRRPPERAPLIHSLFDDSHGQPSHALNGRVVVVSPHLDDAILSLGSSIAHAVELGAQVEVLTVFGDVPSSDATASPWDLDCGFLTEGHAASARREEDRLACSIVGATARWLDFGSEDYERRGSDDDILTAVTSVTADADIVLMPGFPLAHSDHLSLTKMLLQRGFQGQRAGLYTEQPYASHLRSYFKKSSRDAAVAPSLSPMIKGPVSWSYALPGRIHRRAKALAIRCYRSQLRPLGLRNVGLYRMLWTEAARGGEAIAWLG